jgi:outer membrane protein TolC
LRRSAERTLRAAESNLTLTEARRNDGVATSLDVNRAEAEVERARRSISDAELTGRLGRRALQTLTKLEAKGEAEPQAVDLQPPAAVDGYLHDSGKLPAVAAADEQRINADRARVASWLTLAPTLAGSFQERFTNATGFTGRNSLYVLTLTLSWRFDVNSIGTARSQAAAARIAVVREDNAQRVAEDQIYESWARVDNAIARSRAARSEAVATLSAVERARARYAEGQSTQLELDQAERDAFGAEVARIQADADLSFYRAALELDAGHPLDEETQP